MYVQVVTYGLGRIDESEYLDIADELAPRFSGLPGLQAKLWLEDPDLGRYGAIYFWEDRESMERFVRSDLFEATNIDFVEVESEGFGILENLTAQTQPVLEIVQPRRRPALGGGGPAAVPRKTGVKAVPAQKAPAQKAPAQKAPAQKAPAKKAAAQKG